MKIFNSPIFLILIGLFLSAFNLVQGQFFSDSTKIRLLFMGDIMGHDTQITAAWNDSLKTYNYDDCFQFVKKDIEQADISFANLEVPLAGPPYLGYPKFSSPDALAVALKKCGIDVLVTANNHACDKGRNGIDRTINILDSLGIAHTGTFRDSAEYRANNPLILYNKGYIIALLNYTYGTNGVAVPKNKMVNLIDEDRIVRDINIAKAKHPNIIIAFMHWGTEYQTVPESKQIQLATLLKDNGVNLVIGSHPHVLQPMELDKKANHLVVYSLGNFLSGQRTMPRDGSAMVSVEMVRSNDSVVISNAGYMLTYVHHPNINGKRQFIITPVKYVESGQIVEAPGNQGWGRLDGFATQAREILKPNINVNELDVLPH
jgi:poly-gamma-glutamate capsule biosynthesis protein CapA/YwtB (metallophosphatase superfamily)